MIGKDKLILIIAAFCILVAGIIYFYSNVIIPGVQQDTEESVRRELDLNALPKVKAAVVVDSARIARYTVLTEEIINSHIEIIEIPEKYAVKNVVTEESQLLNKIAKEDLRPGEQISIDCLSSEEKWFDEFDRLKEFEVGSIVAGEVKTGNIVDIIVNYGNGDYDIVVPKTKIQKLIEESNSDNSTGTSRQSKKYKVILSVNEMQYRDIEIASKLGVLETRLYIDESQPASPKTFAYEKALEKLKLDIYNQKYPLSEELEGLYDY